MLHNKAQVWFLDFMVSVLIFVILANTYYGYLVAQEPSGSEDILDELILDARTITDSLVSQGYPTNWTNNTVLRVGITDGDHRVNSTKLSEFSYMGINESRRALGTYAQFYFFLETQNGSRIVLANGDDALGISTTDPSVGHVVQTQRIVIYNGSVAVMNLQLWRPK